MPIEIKKSRSITRSVRIELAQRDIVTAVKERVLREDRSLKDYDLNVALEYDADGDACGITAVVTGSITSEKDVEG